MEKEYNKLVRDNIPNIIKNNDGEPYVRILNDVEYKKELEKKLYEEYNEVINSNKSEDRIEELADMIDFIFKSTTFFSLGFSNFNNII